MLARTRVGTHVGTRGDTRGDRCEDTCVDTLPSEPAESGRPGSPLPMAVSLHESGSGGSGTLVLT